GSINPSKASTAQYSYSFTGWSLTAGGSANAKALKAITVDRKVYAAYSKTVRMDTHARLQQLLRERGWTEYKLSKECGLAQSTIGNIFRRNTVPSVATLETICRGFGISFTMTQ
ncbi:helix-turn-helix transcriptional regulator, partial [bacterium]|nr:helix-turn-helix transcriptional regulator [bacterium]